MTSARWHFNRCVPSGRIPIISVNNGDIVRDDFTFTVNGGATPDSQSPNGLDMTSGGGSPFIEDQVRVGADGVFRDETGTIIAECDKYECYADPRTSEVQPLGTFDVADRVRGKKTTLTVGLLKVRDADILMKLLNGARGQGGLATGHPVSLNFQGTLFDDTDQRGG